MPMTDDLLFSKKFLNKVNYYLSKLHMEKVLVGNRYQTNGVFYDNILVYNKNIFNSPIIAAMPAFKREIWNRRGGIDNRYLWSFYDKVIRLSF